MIIMNYLSTRLLAFQYFTFLHNYLDPFNSPLHMNFFDMILGENKTLCIARTVPEGKQLFEFDFTYKNFKDIILTSDNNYFVAYGYDKLKVA